LKFRFAEGIIVTDRLPDVLKKLGLNAKHTFTVEEMKQRIEDAKAQKAHQEDYAIDMGQDEQSQVSSDEDSDSESINIKHREQMLAELNSAIPAPVQKQKSGGNFRVSWNWVKENGIKAYRNQAISSSV
jgi:hypothetical protein